jgi:hypothetical protein
MKMFVEPASKVILDLRRSIHRKRRRTPNRKLHKGADNRKLQAADYCLNPFGVVGVCGGFSLSAVLREHFR